MKVTHHSRERVAVTAYPEEDHDECSLHCCVARHIVCPEWHLRSARLLLDSDGRLAHSGLISISRVWTLVCTIIEYVQVTVGTVRARAYAGREKSNVTGGRFCRFIVNYNYRRSRPSVGRWGSSTLSGAFALADVACDSV